MAELVHHFTTGQVDNGTWLAISTRAPYFCLEGESQAEVEAKANRALDFYFGGKGKVTSRGLVPKRRTRQKTLSTFSPKGKVERKNPTKRRESV